MTTKQGSANNQTERIEPDFRPKALRYADSTRDIEQMIIDVLPDIVRKLSSMALEGNMAAAKYLMDRIHGRPAKLAAAPSTDTSLTFDHFQWSSDQLVKKALNNDRRRIIGQCDAELPPHWKR